MKICSNLQTLKIIKINGVQDCQSADLNSLKWDILSFTNRCEYHVVCFVNI